MNRQMAENLIRIYCSAWLGQDCRAAMSVLDGQAGILECTGTAYDGRAEAKRWFEDWHRQGGRVTEWLVTDVDYDDEKTARSPSGSLPASGRGCPIRFAAAAW